MRRHDPIEAKIQAAAVAKFGAARVEILRVNDRPIGAKYSTGEVWLWLAVGGELLGRRRTELELLQLVEP